jgi:hypothetical protein
MRRRCLCLLVVALASLASAAPALARARPDLLLQENGSPVSRGAEVGFEIHFPEYECYGGVSDLYGGAFLDHENPAKSISLSHIGTTPGCSVAGGRVTGISMNADGDAKISFSAKHPLFLYYFLEAPCTLVFPTKLTGTYLLPALVEIKGQATSTRSEGPACPPQRTYEFTVELFSPYLNLPLEASLTEAP